MLLLEKLVSLNPESALDERKIREKLDEDPDLLNAILFPSSDEIFHEACAKLIGNPAT